MRHWLQYDDAERLQILNIASAEVALPRLAVEKDWWVTMVMCALANTKYASLMSFKGGTSLSKGWGLIERFSEDVDIAIRREGPFAISSASNTQLAKARRAARHYVVRELPLEIEGNLRAMGVGGFTVVPEVARIKGGETYELRADTHPSVIFVNYQSVVPETSEYLLPRVKIEISCLSMDEPVEERTLRSFIAQSVKDVEDVEVKFATVIPTRTFLEKMFLLHEEFQKERPRSLRMSRHLYDLERIMDTDYGRAALADRALYDEIVVHRSIFNKVQSVDYSTHSPATINFMPPPAVMADWRKDYNSLVGNFLYHSDSRLSSGELMARLLELKARVRHMGR